MRKMAAVALSGGVDSSVAAHMVYEQTRKGDYDLLIGASHYIWPDSACCRADMLDLARLLCRRFGIKYYLMDLSESFASKVVDVFSDSYLSGTTPNPCVLCNGEIRFTRFREALQGKLTSGGHMEPDDELYFITGHYARIVETSGGLRIGKGRDPKKDQSYMLYRLPKEDLRFFRFPLGDYLKEEVVDIARREGFPSSSVKESQDICFVEEEYPEFIAEYTGRSDILLPGDIVDLSGRVLGKHRGFLRYTVGQRSGLGLADGPWYVYGVDPGLNRVIVCRSGELKKECFRIGGGNWFTSPPGQQDPGSEPLECTVQTRYNGKEIPCRVTLMTDPGKPAEWEVELSAPAVISPGQSAVFYDGDIVLGGGIIL